MVTGFSYELHETKDKRVNRDSVSNLSPVTSKGLEVATDTSSRLFKGGRWV